MKVYFGIPWWPKNVLSSWWWRLRTGLRGVDINIDVYIYILYIYSIRVTCLRATQSCFEYEVLLPFFFLVGGFKYFWFSPLLGEMIQVDNHFSNGFQDVESSTQTQISTSKLEPEKWSLRAGFLQHNLKKRSLAIEPRKKIPATFH